MAKNPPDRLRVMVDANVLVAGSAWPRFPYEVLQHAVSSDYQLVLSSRILQEARATLAEIASGQVAQLEDILAASQFEEVPTPTDEEIAAHPRLVRDPKDIHVALAAINANVDYLVSQDKDFTAQDETTAELRQRLNILLPAAFLRQHMRWTSEALEAIRKRTWTDLAEE
jgi:putative PIN family toxin of toxin-antitoxin system